MSIIANAHNGGKTQFNFNYQGLGEHAFINRLMEAQEFTTISPSSAVFDPTGFNFDANFYPRAIVSGGLQFLFTCETAYDRPGGVMKLDWAGAGTVKLMGGFTSIVDSSGTIVSNSLTTSTAGGWIRFVPSVDGRPQIGITAVSSSSDYPHAMRAYFIDDAYGTDETDINLGYITSSPLRRLLAQAKFGRVRFLNWGGIGDLISASDTTWALRRPRGCWTGTNTLPRPELYAGITGTGDAFSVTSPGTYYRSGLSLVHGQIAIVQFGGNTSGNTPTFSIDGSTAKRIIGAKFCTANDLTGLNNGRPSNGNIHCMVYDQYLDGWMNFGAATTNGWWRCAMNPETMIDVAAELGMHPDIPIPFLAHETDWVDNLAAYAAAHSASAKNGGWMIPNFETSNETWNNTAGYVSKYFQLRAAAMNGITWTNGVKSIPGPFSVTAVNNIVNTNNVTGQAQLVIGAHSIPKGATVNITNSGGGINSFSGTMIAKAVDATSITTAFGPSNTGPYTGTGLSVSLLDPAVSGDSNKFHGYMMTSIGKKLASAFGVSMGQVKTQRLYRFGCGMQTTVPTVNQLERLWNSYGVLQAGDPNEAAHNWFTSLRMANYWNCRYYSPDSHEASLLTTLNPSGAVAWISAGNQFTITSITNYLVDAGSNNVAVGKYIYAPLAFGAGKFPRITAVSGSGVGAVVTFDGPAQTVETSNAARAFVMFDSLQPLYDYLSSYNTGTGGSLGLPDVYGTYLPNYIALAKGTGVTSPPYVNAWSAIPFVDFYEGIYSNDFTLSSDAVGKVGTATIRWLVKVLWFTDTLPRGMMGLEYDLLKNVINLSDAQVTVEFPSLYTLATRWPATQLWPSMVSVADSMTPAVKAHALFNSGRLRLTAKT